MARRKINEDRARIYGWFLCVIIVLCSLGVIAWLSITPRNPTFRITNVQFQTHPNTTTAANNSLLLVDLEISNPNKRMGIYYYNNISLVLYKAAAGGGGGGGGGGVMGTNSTPGFYQGHKETRSVQLTVHADDSGFWQGRRGVIDFVIRVETAVRFKIVKWKTKMKKIEYEANFRNITTINGTLSGGNFTQQ